jgi:glycine/D-amino acid oxidase-like deaminating enzyme
MVMPDVIVLGAGIIGAAVAYRLSRAGVRVRIFEAERPAAAASRRSFAYINAARKPPRPYHDLNAAGVAEYGPLAADLGGAWLHRTGRLEWAIDAAERTALRDNVARLRAWDYAAESIDQTTASALAPDLRLPPAGTADFAHHPDEGWIEVVPLVAELLTSALAAGATLEYPAPAERLMVEGGRVVGVVSRGTPHHAEVVIDCSGIAAVAAVRLASGSQRSPAC